MDTLRINFCYNDDEEEMVLIEIGHHPNFKFIVTIIRAVLASLVHRNRRNVIAII